MRTVLRRWARFNAVGVAGAVVQLATLHELNRWMAGHYLYAAALALEITLLHNFFFLTRFTWTTKVSTRARLGQLSKFHLANGAVSLAGNLAIMHWLVGKAHVAPVPANAVAIVACSIVNFLVSERWVFFGPRKREPMLCL